MLSDREILDALSEKRLGIVPFSEENLRPNSYLLTLGDEVGFLEPRSAIVSILDKSTFPYIRKRPIGESGYLLSPRQFVLCGTVEKLALTSEYGGIVQNRSGLARLGLSIEISSLISSGYGSSTPAPLTLELYNFSEQPIRLFAGVPVCHVVFHRLGVPSSMSYDRDIGRHSLDKAPEGSRFVPSARRHALNSKLNRL